YRRLMGVGRRSRVSGTLFRARHSYRRQLRCIRDDALAENCYHDRNPFLEEVSFMKLFAPVAVFLLLAVSAFAADVDGKWAGSVSTPMGDFPVAFTFKADGPMLTGSMAGPDGGDIAIKDGMIDGANISFWLSLDLGGNSLKLT